MEWKEDADPQDIQMARQYLGLNEEEGFHWGILRGGMSSVADLFVAQMQDYLGLGKESRMNTPGILGGNWQWRMEPDHITPELTQKIADMTKLYGREP
jgi:4-alpha-glucanotransferase